MELTTTDTTTGILTCTSCYNQVSQADDFCTHCGYPLHGTEAEQKNFIMLKSTKEIHLREANTKIKTASNALYFIAGATMLMGLIAYGTTQSIELKNSILIINTILAAI